MKAHLDEVIAIFARARTPAVKNFIATALFSTCSRGPGHLHWATDEPFPAALLNG